MRWLYLTMGWMAAMSVSVSADPPAAGAPAVVEVFDIGQIEVPADFASVEPQSRIVQHEFEATADGSDDAARITMMAASGGVDANIQRWKGQFSGGDDNSGKVEEKTFDKATVHIVDINGTFADSMGGGPFSGGKKIQRPDYAMSGAIIETKDGRQFFVKMVGPKKVVQANRKAFGQMIHSIGK